MEKRKTLLLTIICLFLILALNPSYALGLGKKQKAGKWNQQAVEALEKGEFLSAIDLFQRALELLPDNKTIKNNLAVTYNNYALSQSQNGNIDTAKKYLYKAIETDPETNQYRENLANVIYAYAESLYKNGDYSSAENQLKETLKFLSNHVPSLILLGQIYYQNQHLTEAKPLWETAYEYEPNHIHLKKLLTKLEKEQEVETDLKQLDAYYFDIRFDKEAVDSEIYDIRFYLQEAYRDIGRDFNYYPKHKIPVILYTEQDFKILRKTPDWVAGIFDGKIRLPIKEGTLTEIELKRLIWHEYTHAVILDLTQGKCPIWFNEGLAKWEESKQQSPDTTPLTKAIEENKLIPLGKLGTSFSMQTNLNKLNLAYLEAYSFIEFMLDRWNPYILRGILDHLKNGKSIEKAFYEETYRSMDKIEREWREYLLKRYCH